MILFLDPSSTYIGWAEFNDAGGDPVRFGRLVGKGDNAVRRIVRLCDDLADICAGDPRAVVVEIPSGKVSRKKRARGMNGAGLSVYGMAVGYYLGWLNTVWMKRDDERQVHVVTEFEWTNRRIGGRNVAQTKEQRQAWVAQCHRKNGYDPADDPGGDVADAIALGEWWFTEQRMKGLVERQSAAR
jgi:hypothetical protein